MPLRRATGAAALALLAFAAALAGCAGRGYGPPPDASDSPPPPFNPAPNYKWSWSGLNGTFHLHRLQTRLLAYNTTTNASRPYPASCTTPYSYDLDAGNRTLTVTNRTPLHPTDPGRLRVVLLHELLHGPQCKYRAAFGINENVTTPGLCLLGVPASEAPERGAWACHLPVDPINDAKAVVWVNVSVTFDASTASGFRVGIGARSFAGDEAGNATWWVRHPAAPIAYQVHVALQPYGAWPYAALRRAG